MLSDKNAAEPQFLSRKEAAAYLAKIGCPIGLRTLATLASNNNEGKGPRFTRTRWKIVRYLKTDLDAWAKANTQVVE